MKATKDNHTLSSRRAALIDTEIAVPPDKSISHRAVMLAALSNGTCVIRNFLEGEDCRSTAAAMPAAGRQSGAARLWATAGVTRLCATHHSKATSPMLMRVAHWLRWRRLA